MALAVVLRIGLRWCTLGLKYEVKNKQKAAVLWLCLISFFLLFMAGVKQGYDDSGDLSADLLADGMAFLIANWFTLLVMSIGMILMLLNNAMLVKVGVTFFGSSILFLLLREWFL